MAYLSDEPICEMFIGVPILDIPRVPILGRYPILIGQRPNIGTEWPNSLYFSFCDMLIVYIEVYVAIERCAL